MKYIITVIFYLNCIDTINNNYNKKLFFFFYSMQIFKMLSLISTFVILSSCSTIKKTTAPEKAEKVSQEKNITHTKIEPNFERIPYNRGKKCDNVLYYDEKYTKALHYVECD